MLQINEHYDDKGACSWSLLNGGYYYNKERLDNAINGLMKDIINHDKKARKALMVKPSDYCEAGNGDNVRDRG